MAAKSEPGYGEMNFDMIQRWLQLEPDQDGPFWALNLMKYREVADYGDGQRSVSGREADDTYSPLGPLKAVGARVAFYGDVTEQPLGRPNWDRVAVVCYPSRNAFLAMQRRDDFKEKHVHKEAGMEFTIIMACIPVTHRAKTEHPGEMVLVVERGRPSTLPASAEESASFSVEGVIIGDKRTYDRARFLSVPTPEARKEVVEWASAMDEAHLVVVDVAIDQLVETIAGKELQ